MTEFEIYMGLPDSTIRNRETRQISKYNKQQRREDNLRLLNELDAYYELTNLGNQAVIYNGYETIIFTLTTGSWKVEPTTHYGVDTLEEYLNGRTV